jgi:hypothetical protein
MDTVSVMLSRRAVLVVLAILWFGMSGAFPAAAHGPVVESIPAVEPAAAAEPTALPGWVLSAPPAGPELPWPALAVVVAATALAWVRPRRTIALALVLLLAIFAFEDAVHSVHHGFDQTQASSCTVAAVGAQLIATAVDGADACEVILALVALATSPGVTDPITRPASPDRGRAPPFVTPA